MKSFSSCFAFLLSVSLLGGCTTPQLRDDAPVRDASTRDSPDLDSPGLDAPAIDAPILDAPGLDTATSDVGSGDAPIAADVPATPDAPGPIDCTGRTIAGVARQTGGDARIRGRDVFGADFTRYAGIWEAYNAAYTDIAYDTYWARPTPGFVLGVYPNRYVALEFRITPGEGSPAGTLSTEIDSTFASRGFHWTISQCPGDFTVDEATGCRGWTVGNLVWELGESTPRLCNLEPNVTYYLNILYGRRDAPTTTTCDAAVCGNVWTMTTFAP